MWKPRRGEDVSDQTLSLSLTSEQPASPDDRIEIAVGETVGRYQVRRLLGKGGMGQVYLARDVVLGRSVALKIVGLGKPARSSDQFIDEARAIARLNHPHVVQLYDFGEYQGALYLALEYVEGDTLRERMRSGPIGLDEAMRFARAIADGLAHAHAKGVYHCDLKPSNAMIGRDGRVRVVDFGIARTGENADAACSGSPDWMAPEQWACAPLTDRVDSWALGVVVAQLITGTHPLGDLAERRRAAVRDPGWTARWKPAGSGPMVPAAVVELVNRALEREPGGRPSAAEWARVLDGVLVDGRGDAAIDDGPYRGLLAFDEKHARFYFGRELEIDAFVERLRDTPQLPIVGPSGAGKSSFLHAGVIPRLRARDPWTVIALRPGGDPIGALAHHVLAASGDGRSEPRLNETQRKAQVQAFRAELLETPTLLAARLATIASARGGPVLLAIDQLEEAFTQGASEHERERFLQMLLTAVDDALDPVRVVVTVRDDFVGKLAGLRSLFVVKKLGIDDLRRTITGPLARYDYELDDAAIADDLIAEVGSADAGKLPLLQFACRTLWDGRDVGRRRLLRATYREMGGLAGALARHADHALTELSPGELRTARQLLLQLVIGTTRRSVARDQLISGLTDADCVLDRLLTARLVVQRNAGDGEPPLVEIAHESLVQTWSQLARWLDESREERRLLEDLEDAAKLWERRGRRLDDVWSDTDLAGARHRAVQLDLTLPPRVEAFFAAGDQRDRAVSRRRRLMLAGIVAAAIAVAVPVSFVVSRFLVREELIDSNVGTVELELIPFDWRSGAAVPASIAAAPELRVALYEAKPDDVNLHGDPLADKLIRISPANDLDGHRFQRISAPGGTVYLRLDGRGRPGEHCAPSWIRIQSFPGYRTNVLKHMRLPVPTCQATAADVVTVESGPFIYGGPGEPKAVHYGESDYTEPEQMIDLPAFAMDRTEVSNAAFAPFADMTAVTGYVKPEYPIREPGHLHDGDPDYPVGSVSAFEANAYCEYMGKKLPSDFQWVKAARGGISVHGRPNPYPRRLYPWGIVREPSCVNLKGEQDGYPWKAPVDAFACGASPYGILQLAGNVQEWIARDGQSHPDTPMHVVRGGGADETFEGDDPTTIVRNPRLPLSAYFTLGIRCIVDGDGLSGSL